MRKYLLDTSVMTTYLWGRQGAVNLISPWIRNREAATSILVYGEVVEYIKTKSNYQQRYTQLGQAIRQIYPYFLTYPIMERYADLRLQLRPQGRLIGDIDTLIAATALERNLTLVTIDSDYQRVPSLNVMLLSRSQLV